MQIRFIRFVDDVKIPERMHPTDTGADIFMRDCGIIAPGETRVIPLGFGLDIPNGYNARMQVRTSIAQHGIIIQGCAIDAGYTGELHMILHNVSNDMFTWKKNDRLGYIEIYPCQYATFVEIMPEQRGKNSFGSTGE